MTDKNFDAKTVFYKVPVRDVGGEDRGLPAETNILEANDGNQPGRESYVRQIRVATSPTEVMAGAIMPDINFNFKPQVTDAVERAKVLMVQYETARQCLGEKHTAKTGYTVGIDKNDAEQEKKEPWPSVHTYQESLMLGDMYSTMGRGKFFTKNDAGQVDDVARTIRIKELGLDGLSQLLENDITGQEYERHVCETLLKYQRTFQDFYPVLVESFLLGYVPDLKAFRVPGGEGVYVGVLFSGNFGLTEVDGLAVIKQLDFGYEQMDLLTPQSRERLKELIERYKKENELPIYRIKRRSGGHIVKLASWYEQALKTEIGNSLTTEDWRPVGVYLDGCLSFDERVAIVVQKIKDSVGTGTLRRRKMLIQEVDPLENVGHFSELDAYRRLCNASEYGTEIP